MTPLKLFAVPSDISTMSVSGHVDLALQFLSPDDAHVPTQVTVDLADRDLLSIAAEGQALALAVIDHGNQPPRVSVAAQVAPLRVLKADGSARLSVNGVGDHLKLILLNSRIEASDGRGASTRPTWPSKDRQSTASTTIGLLNCGQAAPRRSKTQVSIQSPSGLRRCSMQQRQLSWCPDWVASSTRWRC